MLHLSLCNLAVTNRYAASCQEQACDLGYPCMTGYIFESLIPFDSCLLTPISYFLLTVSRLTLQQCDLRTAHSCRGAEGCILTRSVEDDVSHNEHQDLQAFQSDPSV